MKKKVLLIGGSINQTTMMHKVGKELSADFDCKYTPFYADGILGYPRKWRLLDKSIAGYGSFYRDSMEYFEENNLPLNMEGREDKFDMVVMCTDMVVPHNIRGVPRVMVQEGMTDPENWWFKTVRALNLPLWAAANTCGTGLTDLYDKFCVASEGYREHFIRNGVKPEKIEVTGIPNYDCAETYLDNDFPHKNYALCATSDVREVGKKEDRKATIERAKKLAGDKQLIFKLHPNEWRERAEREIAEYAPGALVYQKENVHELIANCDVLITKFSTVVFTGIALNKEVYSDFDMDYLRKLTPIQNSGRSAAKIADICRGYL